MQVATGASMLNFGYWLGDANNPVDAQTNLCTLVGKLADLGSSKILTDVGSGYGAPALQWSEEYKLENIICVNINSQQLVNGFKIASSKIENVPVSMLVVYEPTLLALIAVLYAYHLHLVC